MVNTTVTRPQGTGMQMQPPAPAPGLKLAAAATAPRATPPPPPALASTSPLALLRLLLLLPSPPRARGGLRGGGPLRWPPGCIPPGLVSRACGRAHFFFLRLSLFSFVVGVVAVAVAVAVLAMRTEKRNYGMMWYLIKVSARPTTTTMAALPPFGMLPCAYCRSLCCSNRQHTSFPFVSVSPVTVQSNTGDTLLAP